MKVNYCQQLENYFDDCLDAGERSAFEQHLESCLSCQSELLQIVEVEKSICDAWAEITIPYSLKPEKVSIATRSTGIASTRNKKAIAWTSLAGLVSAIFLTFFLASRPPQVSKHAAVSHNGSSVQDSVTQPVAFYESGDNGTLLSPVVSTAEFTIVNAFPASTSFNTKPESAK